MQRSAINTGAPTSRPQGLSCPVPTASPSNVLPCVERRTLSRDTLIVYTFEDLLLPIYENLLDLLLFYILFSTTILINNKNYRGVSYPITCRFSHLPRIHSYQQNISDFKGRCIEISKPPNITLDS